MLKYNVLKKILKVLEEIRLFIELYVRIRTLHDSSPVLTHRTSSHFRTVLIQNSIDLSMTYVLQQNLSN